MFFELQKTLGLSTGVIVSPGGYGKDYTMLADVLAKHPDRFRGIALVKDDIPSSELARLTKLGVHGMRMMSTTRGSHVPNYDPSIAAKVHEHGWHIQFYPHGTDITEYADKLLALKNDIVLDHFASIPAEGGADQPAMKAVMKMLDTGRVWLKLSGPMRCTMQNMPYPSVTPMAQRPGETCARAPGVGIGLAARQSRRPRDAGRRHPARSAARMGAGRGDAQAHPGRQREQALRIPGNAAMSNAARQKLLDRVRTLAPAFAERAEAAERTRQLPAASARDMLDAGLARILMPARFGGHDLDFATWLDAVLDISKADASHGWCASLITHHAHLIAQFPEETQKAVWADGPDVAIAASFAPRAQATRVEGGYRVSGANSSFASGVGHSSWVMVGALLQGSGAPEWVFFMIPPGQYQVRDTWFTAGMCGTGSNTIVTDNVFVPEGRMLSLTDLRQGKGPGAAMNASPINRAPFFFYAPLTFAAPMLGAAQGAYEHFREWTKTRRAVDGSSVAEKTSIQVGMARVAADLDAAELLLRRSTHAHEAPEAEIPQALARSIRDFARVSELSVGSIDALMAMSGTAGFATSQPIQRAWRDIHFAASHISLNTETNYAHFGRLELGLPRDPSRPFF